MNVKFNVMAFLLFILSLSACASPATSIAEVAPVPSDAESSVSKNEAGLYPLSTRSQTTAWRGMQELPHVGAQGWVERLTPWQLPLRPYPER